MLLSRGIITREQLSGARAIQSASGTEKRLGRILLEEGALTQVEG